MATRHVQNGTGGIVAAIVRLHYVATLEQVEQLGHSVMLGEEADATYLNVVLAHIQGRIGRPRRGAQPPQLPVLETVHAELYPAFLRGVGPEDMDADERNRLGTRARTAASTVRFFIEHGGDVRGLKLPQTKNGLRKLVQPESPAPEGETRRERTFRKAAEGVVRAASALARGDPDAARQRIEQLLDRLEALLGPETETVDVGSTTTLVGSRVTPRVSNVPAQLHRGAG